MPPSASTARAILIVLDSVGVGELPDAAAYGDAGSNTLGNLARQIPLQIPALRALGLACIQPLDRFGAEREPQASYGRMAEASPGKDSVTGHWELMGLLLDRAFPVYEQGFPAPLIAEFERQIGRRSLGNIAASGTRIIEDLGPEHVRTGWPIVYTSADSVFQIAAHEEVIPVAELYRYCRVAYTLAVEGLGLGRIIARPFVGTAGGYRRTANRRDFAMPPVRPTLLDGLKAAGFPVVAIGKIEDLFAKQGMTEAYHTACDDEGMDEVERALDRVPNGLIFVNLVDFDTLYGHRNDPAGYAANLERFDARLSEVLPRLRDDDLLVITADHGNDPTTSSTDHSREYVPLLVTGPRVRRALDLGTRATYADLAQTLASFFGLPPLEHGRGFLDDVWQAP